MPPMDAINGFLLFRSLNLFEDLLGRRHGAAGRVDPHHHGLDPRHFFEALQLGEHAPRVVDRAIDLQNADAVTGKKRQHFGIPAGEIGVEENSGKHHQDKNEQQSQPAQYRMISSWS